MPRIDPTFEVGDPAGERIWAADAGDATDPSQRKGLGRTIRGNLHLDGDRLVTTTNSVARAERLAAMIDERFGDATLIEDLRCGVGDAQADRDDERAIDGDDDGGSELVDMDAATPPSPRTAVPSACVRPACANCSVWRSDSASRSHGA